jgi:hypothetical protein
VPDLTAIVEGANTVSRWTRSTGLGATAPFALPLPAAADRSPISRKTTARTACIPCAAEAPFG